MAKDKIIYFTDILCGYCFGFGPTISMLHKEYGDRFDFHVVSGGLFLDSWSELVKKDAPLMHNGEGATAFALGVKPAGLINEVAPHIKAGAYKEVEAKYGVKFGQAFLKELDKGSMRMNSLYPAMALCIVREKYPHKAVEFTSLMLNAIYVDGIDSEDISSFKRYASQVGYDADKFELKMNDPAYKEAAMEDFRHYRDQPLQGFPSLMLEKEGNRSVLFTKSKDYAQIKKNLDEYLN